jgi:hypothetical protein
MGVSKELRLSSSLRIALRYAHRRGFDSILAGTYAFSDELGFSQDATYKVTVGGAFLSGGLKLLLPDQFNKHDIYKYYWMSCLQKESVNLNYIENSNQKKRRLMKRLFLYSL